MCKGYGAWARRYRRTVHGVRFAVKIKQNKNQKNVQGLLFWSLEFGACDLEFLSYRQPSTVNRTPSLFLLPITNHPFTIAYCLTPTLTLTLTSMEFQSSRPPSVSVSVS